MSAPTHCSTPGLLQRTRNQTGFSLVEILVVMAIMAILLALTIPAYQSFNEANRVTSSGYRIVDLLNLARQTALAKTVPVEVRFYQVPESGTPIASGEVVPFRAIGLLERVNNEFKDFEKLQSLSPGIMISSNATYSSLFASPPQPDPLPQDKPPGGAQDRPYVSMQFKSDGSVKLPSTPPGFVAPQLIFLTVHAARAPKNGPGGVLPANFATIQIDLSTGRAKVVRP